MVERCGFTSEDVAIHLHIHDPTEQAASLILELHALIESGRAIWEIRGELHPRPASLLGIRL